MTSVCLVRRIAARPAIVFEALVTAEGIRSWWGPDDRPVYGVMVKIRRADQRKPKWELYSNHTGEFAQRLPAGKATYIVWADTKGLKSLNGKKIDPGTEVTVRIESEERMDIGLHLKEVKE